MLGQIVVADLDKCTGCRLCEMFCSLEHDGVCNPSASRVRVVRFVQEAVFVPSLCMQCTERMCRNVCPVGAIRVDPSTGANLVDDSRCIGCRECVMACPFGAMTLHNATGKAMVCDLCGGDPACVKACASGALTFTTVGSENMARRRQRACVEAAQSGAGGHDER